MSYQANHRRNIDFQSFIKNINLKLEDGNNKIIIRWGVFVSNSKERTMKKIWKRLVSWIDHCWCWKGGCSCWCYCRWADDQERKKGYPSWNQKNK